MTATTLAGEEITAKLTDAPGNGAPIGGLKVTHEPDMSLFEIGSDTLDMGAVGDVMDDRGWHLDRQQGGLHLMLSPYHAHITEAFLADLAEAAATTEESRGKAAGYGGIA